MLFVQYLPEDARGPLPVDWLLSLAEQDTRDLERSKWIDSGPEVIWPGGGAGDAKIQRPEYEAPDDGPISVILFEFSRGEPRQ
jgi:hypothetical protein